MLPLVALSHREPLTSLVDDGGGLQIVPVNFHMTLNITPSLEFLLKLAQEELMENLDVSSKSDRIVLYR
jgi:hypothetical protein